MKDKLYAFAASIGIDQIGIAPVRIYGEIVDKLSDEAPFCTRQRVEDKINPYLLMENAKSAIVYLIPYNVGVIKPSNISRYSWVRDYHEVALELSNQINDFLSAQIPDYEGRAFCDITPIPQKYLAYLAGLGFFGDNKLLINEKYGSWFFIAHILTNYPFMPDAPLKKACMHCGKCIKACPRGVLGKEKPDFNHCISMITQKKSPLAIKEEMCFCDTLWGCDICQLVCPHNQEVAVTPLTKYFGEPVAYLDESNLSLSHRAFSYRKEKFMLRNLKLFEKQNPYKDSDLF